MRLRIAMQRTVSAFGVALLAGAVGVSATAAPKPAPQVRVLWERGPGTEACLTAPQLEQAVEARLGRKLFAGRDAAALTLRVKLAAKPEGGGFHAAVWVETADGRDPGTRELEVPGSDCRALDEPLALVVSLIADSELGRAADRTVEPLPDPYLDRELSRPVLTVPSLQAPKREPWRWQVHAGALLSIGALPDPAPGIDLAVLARPPRFVSLLAHAATFYPNTEDVADGARLSFWLAYAGIGLCPELAGGTAASLAACLGADVGALRARSRGLVDSRVTYRLVVQSELTLRGTLELGRGWLASTSAGLLLPLKPETFHYRRADGETEKAFQMAHLTFVAGLGLGFRLR